LQAKKDCKRGGGTQQSFVPSEGDSSVLHFFVGQGHYGFVGSVCKQINKIYANEDEDMKVTFSSNVAVSRNLAELCLKDHQKLG
jgi:hypothetical protein